MDIKNFYVKKYMSKLVKLSIGYLKNWTKLTTAVETAKYDISLDIIRFLVFKKYIVPSKSSIHVYC